MIQKFIDYLRVERRYSERTIWEYERDLTEFCSFLNVEKSRFEVACASQEDVRLWMVDMLDRGLSPRSVKRKLSALRSFYKFLLRVGLTSVDITRSLVTPKADKPLPVFFKESEIAEAESGLAYADDFESVRDGLILEILYQTGMRRAELIGLCDADVDLVQSQLRVFGKRRKERIVPFGGGLKAQIEMYVEYRDGKFPPSSPAEQPFIINNKGVRMTAGVLYRIVRKRMGEVSSLKKHSPHVLRHTFATSMLNAGVDINTIKTLMGHASLAATQVYTHTTFSQLQSAYNKAHPRGKKKE